MSDKQNFNIRPLEVNPTIDKASDTGYILVVLSPENRELDLKGYSMLMQLRPYVKSKRILDTMSTENGRITVDGGKIALHFPASVTAEYQFDSAVYDLVAVSKDGLRYRIAEGQIEFNPEVTRDLV